VDLFASRLNHQIPIFYSWHPEPGTTAVDAFLQPWQKHPRMGQSTFQFNRTGLGKGAERQMHNHAHRSNLVNTTLVSDSNRNVNRLSPSFTSKSRPIPSWKVRERTSTQKSKLELGRLAYLRQTELFQGLSADTFDFISTKLRHSSLKNYQYSWGLFAKWWNQQSFTSSDITPTRVASFLHDIFKQGYSYSACNGFRSAISVTAPPFQGILLGQHPLVVSVMEAVKQQIPPQPKYQESWDLNILLDYIDLNLSTNSQLSLPQLRSKAITLLRLSSISRSTDLLRIKYSSVKFTSTQVSFDFKPIKNSKSIIHTNVQRLDSKPSLCPVAVLETYIHQFRDITRINDQVFLSITPPFMEVSSQVIAKDTLELMKAAGLDTVKYKAHSTRMAAATAAIDKGVSVEDVMKVGRWLSWSVFERFYNRAKVKSNFTQKLFE
jgi:hypothetical protein